MLVEYNQGSIDVPSLRAQTFLTTSDKRWGQCHGSQSTMCEGQSGQTCPNARTCCFSRPEFREKKRVLSATAEPVETRGLERITYLWHVGRKDVKDRRVCSLAKEPEPAILKFNDDRHALPRAVKLENLENFKPLVSRRHGQRHAGVVGQGVISGSWSICCMFLRYIIKEVTKCAATYVSLLRPLSM